VKVCAGPFVQPALRGHLRHGLKFSNPAGGAGVRKLLAAANSTLRADKIIDALNFLCA
jgi:hypothetical protein